VEARPAIPAEPRLERHKPNSVHAFACWRSFISRVLHVPGPLLRVRPIPEVYCPLSRKVERATRTSALSCTTWGLSCDLAYAKIRWALTPPFHPCPAPSFRTLNGIKPSDLLAGAKLRRDGAGGLFSETLSVTWGFCPKVPPFSRGTLPSGVRTFLWLGVNHASDRLPQSESNIEEASAPGEPRTSRQQFG
jgi:hypothetical protein